MARIDIPASDKPEIEAVWGIVPDLGAAVGNLSAAVYYGDRLLPARVREVARMTIAHINGCSVCMGWRIPKLAEQGVDEELYAHVEDPANGAYSGAERLAIDYARRFATDHRSIDDDFFALLKAEFSEPEILELTILIADWMAFGRVTAVLDLDEACAWAPSTAGQG
jgi:AhpD family alkylhydroperoxidase